MTVRRVLGVGALVGWAVLTASLFLRDGDSMLVGRMPPASAVAPIAVRPAGSAIDEDFVVAEGSYLIGTAVPYRLGGGWHALLYLSGDPEKVLDRYVGQGAVMGWEELVPDRLGKRDRDGTWPEDRDTISRCGLSGPPSPEDNVDVPPTYQCATTISSTQGDCLQIQIVRADDGAALYAAGPERRPVSHVSLQRHTAGCSPTWVTADPDAPAPPEPTTWPPLPRTGDTVSWGVTRFRPSTVPLPEGAFVVAAPAFTDPGPSCTPELILKVSPSEADQIATAYMAAFDPGYVSVEDFERSTSTFGRAEITNWSTPSIAGGDSFDVTLIEEAVTSWLRIQQCGDQ